ncbi:MAG: 16S rRNA (uracil(1498)-N(3))-methyltransferase [Burkholderiaceae bacterium]
MGTPRIPRLHVPGGHLTGDVVELAPDASHQLARVLRLRAGEPVQLFDGQGRRFAARVLDADARRCRLRVDGVEAGLPDGPLRITLAQCLSSAEKMDWTIEKAVELGVHAIVPLASARSVVRLDPDRARRRAEHWARLVAAACAQCGRDRLPVVHEPLALAAWLASPRAGARRFVLSPGTGTRIGALPSPGDDVELLVGPESGLSDEELAQALAAGCGALSLGPRVLRTETAGLAAVAALQARFGDL